MSEYDENEVQMELDEKGRPALPSAGPMYIKWQHNWPYTPYGSYNVSISVGVDQPHYDEDIPEVVAQTMDDIGRAYGRALLQVLERSKRYNDDQISAVLDHLVPVNFHRKIRGNDFVLDAIMQAAAEIEEERSDNDV